LSLGETSWWWLFVSWMLLVADADFRLRRVPNLLLVIATALQVVWLTYCHWQNVPSPGAGLWLPALAGFLLGLSFILLWTRGVMGAGDVKFLAVLGLWVGWAPLLLILVGGSLLAGIHALLVWIRTRYFPVALHTAVPLPTRKRFLPYAGYLAIAALSLAAMQWNSPSCSPFSLWSCTPS